MDFSVSNRHRKIADQMATISSHLVDPQLQERDRLGLFSRDLWGILCRHGLHLLPAAPECGGSGYSAQDLAIALESLGEHCEDTGLVFALAAHLCACIHPLVVYGGAQQRQWLARIERGGLIGAHAITEEGAGSDVGAMETTAVRERDGYRINGAKRYITNAPVSDFIVLHARTSQTGSFLDYSAFILDRSTPGVRVSDRPLDKIGLRTTAMGSIEFKDVFVPERARLGHEGSGGPIFQASMEWERTCLFAMYLGTMRRQLRQTCHRVESRSQFGEPLIEQQAVSHRLAEMALRLEAARLAVYRAAWSLDQRTVDPSAAAVAKLLTSEAAVQNGLDAVHLHGAAGVLSGDVERQLRNALPSTLFSGTTDILKNQLVRHLRAEGRRTATSGAS